MTKLHIINKPATSTTLMLAAAAFCKGDAVLFIEDGVTALVQGSESARQIPELFPEGHICCLSADVSARGLEKRVSDTVTLVDYDGFVLLTEQHTHTLSWF